MNHFDDWDRLSPSQRASLERQVTALDLVELQQLYANREKAFPVPGRDRIKPLTHIVPDVRDDDAIRLGNEALAAGHVAALVVAGGQGTRLGFDHPKGVYPVGPLTQKTLFQFHAERVLARSRAAGRPIPFLVMTSDVTHAETEAYFVEHQFLGLPREHVHFFQQGTMPALDLASGRLIRESADKLFAGPDGHGGTLTALAKSGLLDRLATSGVKHLFYFQVDNPLVAIADPQFLGHHVRANAQVSSKVIPKESPTDKLGNFVLIDDRLSMIEYSDLPDDLARATDADGQLAIRAGNPAIHIFDVGFLQQITTAGLPFHYARKKVPYYDPATGRIVTPSTENALKFERFIFDVLPLADRHCEVFTSRQDEFAPLKNASGPDSPETVRRAISDVSKKWLRSQGKHVGDELVEVSPLEMS